MFRRAGYKIDIKSRSYHPSIDDPEISASDSRPGDCPLRGDGFAGCGLTGYDWVIENNADVVEIAELVYGKVGRAPLRWVLAVPNDSLIKCANNSGRKRITEAMGMTKAYLERHGVNATVEFSWGATEVKPPHLADAIVEITETGSSLKANDLRIVDTICETTTRFIANKESAKDPFKRAKMDKLALLLQAVLTKTSRIDVERPVDNLVRCWRPACHATLHDCVSRIKTGMP